ncbi:MAG: acylneuraminate cytidylyltransferase family protein [Deltaproteobacteria bacterium]|nr:acylneuraminate cytidylyltransferase family protein [Deltaproteobacteria bacterium]
MRVLGVIPARGGSREVRRKNLRALAGRPLVAYVIDAAHGARSLDRVIVSTEDDEIAEVARALGAEVPFVRPAALARDEVSLIPVVRHAMEFADAQGFRADILVSIQPTSPLLTGGDIDRAVGLLMETGCDSVMAVVRIQQGHPYRALRVEDGQVRWLFPEAEGLLQRQDLPVLFRPTGGLYVRRRELLERWEGRDFALGARCRALVLDAAAGLNIDTEADLLLADGLLGKAPGEARVG